MIETLLGRAINDDGGIFLCGRFAPGRVSFRSDYCNIRRRGSIRNGWISAFTKDVTLSPGKPLTRTALEVNGAACSLQLRRLELRLATDDEPQREQNIKTQSHFLSTH
jgi:hypothetical protein